MSKSESEDTGSSWLSNAVFAFTCMGGLVIFWPGLIAPFSFFEFWRIKGDFYEIVWSAWPLYLWGFGTTMILLLSSSINATPGTFGEKFVDGTVQSALAGVLEEIAFRWLLFFAAFVSLPIFNWILGGFMGFDLIRWLYVDILCPIANFFTLGYLDSYLNQESAWVVGAAMISTNGQFRNGHAYQGPFGFVNSWFGGMYLHWVVFNYGLLPAIAIHFFYNFTICTLVAIMTGSSDRPDYSRRWR